MNGDHPDLRALVHALVNPTSNEEYIRNQQTLTDLFKEPEFFIALQSYASDRSLSQPERLLASVITSREMKAKWRSKALIPESRKPEIRERLFSFLEEPDLAIARPQLTLLVSIARIEYPKTFPNLPQLLLNPLQTCISHLQSSGASSTTSTVLLNTLWTINALVKEWKTVKLSVGGVVMSALEEVFTRPVGEVLAIWSRQRLEGDWTISEAGRYAFKILARFSQWHWQKAKGLQTETAQTQIQNLLYHSVQHAPLIQTHRLNLLSDRSHAKLLHSLIKHLRAIGKWWRVMISADPKGFTKLQGTVEGVGWWWGAVGGVVAGTNGAVANDDSDDVAYPKRFLLLGMLLFKDILPILAVDRPDIFTPPFILSALHLLIDKLLPLTSTDLESLEDEPEEWLIAENNDEEAWSFEFRPCAERVLMALNNSCRHLPADQKVIEPEMLKILSESEAAPPNELPSILRRESVYCAMGRVSRSLSAHGGVDFNAFLGGIATWLGQGLPLHRIVKRRIAWLIGQWVSADEECAKLPLVWQILLHLLTERGESSDMAVNLSTAVAIKECVDLWEMEIDYFLPYLQQTTEGLIKLLGEAATLPGKTFVNDTIGVVIERTDDKITRYLPILAQAIPGLWQGATSLEGEWLFKASLVVLTTKLVSAAKESSGGLMDLVIPLIEESLVPPAKEYFEEDGLILWQTALHNATSPFQPTPETGLIRLLPGLLAILGENMDLLGKLLTLLESYLLLDSIIQTSGSTLCSTLSKALQTSKLNTTSIQQLLSTISLLVRTSPLHSLAPLLLDSGIFQHILKSLEDDKASGLILAAYLEILSRIALSDAGGFLEMVAETGRREGRDGGKVLEEVLDAVWRNFDYVAEGRTRKAVAMGVGTLLTTGNHQVLDRLDGEIMNIFLDVLGEIQASQEDPTAPEAAVSHWRTTNSVQWNEIERTPEGARRSTLEDSDPAYAIPLKQYIINVLTTAQGVGLGPYWEKADEGTRRSLEKFLA